MKNVSVYIAEVLGTFGLVFFGTGAIVVNQEFEGVLSHTGVAIAWGLTVAVMIYTFGNISGAHMNPAVTITLWAFESFSALKVIPYFLSQSLGAFGASYLLHLFFPINQTLGSTLPSGSPWISFTLEFILTFFLMMTIFRVASEDNNNHGLAGLIIGFVVLLEALVAGPVCGASMNPIRSLAPAIVSGHTEFLWIYLFAPITGAFSAGLFNKYIFRTKQSL